MEGERENKGLAAATAWEEGAAAGSIVGPLVSLRVRVCYIFF
jgi:hypothetical protein